MVKVGDPTFRQEWQRLKASQAYETALLYLLDCLDMPGELSGQLEENQALVARFAADLAPHDKFWLDLAAFVRHLMKNQDMREKTDLNRRLHQLRYVISAQQAQYVRQHYRQQGMTDRAALIAYLRDLGLSYRSLDNARLHNKRLLKKEEESFPDDEESYNIKILLGAATEFILDSQGRFLNEVDAEQVTTKGIVNGASFNYGRTFGQHIALDVVPVSSHDPEFRNRIAKPYRSPNQIGKSFWSRLWQKNQSGFERSFYNKNGYYAKNGHSLVQLIKKEKKDFKREWKGRRFSR